MHAPRPRVRPAVRLLVALLGMGALAACSAPTAPAASPDARLETTRTAPAADAEPDSDSTSTAKSGYGNPHG